MPLRKVPGGWKIGTGPTIKTKAAADRAYAAYRAKRHGAPKPKGKKAK